MFQIQPMIGKYFLPWFGSSPAVWSASLLFFQVVLSFGYAYAYGLARWVSFRRQVLIHLAVIAVSLFLLILTSNRWPAPILPDTSFQPGEVGKPFWQVMMVLAISVGVPFLLLATNSTLMQSWYYQIFPNRSPYRLYALSNFASLLGLISYPFIFELYLTIIEQARIWALFYCLFAISVVYICFQVIRSNIRDGFIEKQNKNHPLSEDNKPGYFIYLFWFLLPAIASVLLLAVTNQITQEVAVIPFLWVLPLSLYLISFIFCFDGDNWYGRTRFTYIFGITVLVYWLMIGQGPLVNIEIQVTTYCLLLFVCCMVCHGELAKLRPGPDKLTSFYLLIALGGAAGGIFVNLLAPVIFKQYQELFIGLISCCIIYAGAMLFVNREKSKLKLAAGVTSLTGILIILVLITVNKFQAVQRGTLWMERNFFGVLRVKEKTFEPGNESAYELIHGITIHGIQFVNPDLKKITTSYYTETSGVGLAYAALCSKGPIKTGILGLGVGTIAAYGNMGDTIRFYEINPAVIEIALGAGNFFSYISESKANVEIIFGDARLSLEKEFRNNGSQQYDLLVLDTFSSDAIPVHLMTNEAFMLYLNHLKDDGVLAVHISNIHLDLQPVVNELANANHLYSAVVTSGKTRPGSSASVWVLMTLNQEFLLQPKIREYAFQMDDYPLKVQLWTDNYSNLYQILR